MTDQSLPPEVQETAPAASNSDIVTTLETENFIDTYQLVAEWIRFADAKAAAVLTACGALAGVLIPTLREFLEDKTHIAPWWEYVGVALFAIWLAFLMVTSWSAFRCILPYRKDGKHPAIDRCNHFHPAGIASAFKLEETSRFSEESSQLNPGEFMKEVMAGLHIDSHISANKYKNVSLSIRLLGWSAIFGFLYLIASQF